MKVKVVSSFKPGRYVRRQVVCEGMWVDVEGFLILPIGKGARKWVGLAKVKLSHAPLQQPKAFYLHDAHHKPLKVSYDPTRRKMQFTNCEGATATFTMAHHE